MNFDKILFMHWYIQEPCFFFKARYFWFINNIVIALDWYKNVFFLNVFRSNGWILITVCIYIDIYKIHVVSNAHYFWSLLTESWPLSDIRILFMLNILWINLWISIKFCIIYWYWQNVDLDDWKIFFIHFQPSYGPWLMPKFHLCLISCWPIDEFW